MSDLLRCLRIIALTNEQRMRLLAGPLFEAEWFLEHVDDLAPELHRRGWVEHQPFDEQPGSVTVIDPDDGPPRMLVVTKLGRAALAAATVAI